MNNTIEQEIAKLEKNYIRILQQQQIVESQVLAKILNEYQELKTSNTKLELPDFLLERDIINKMQHRLIVKKLRDHVRNDQNSSLPKKKSYKSYGPYKILERVASGAMGVIYKAEDTRDNGIVALKIIRDGGDAKKIRKQRFDREARSALKVKSPGVVTIRDTGEINNIPYIAMDFVEGSTLDEYWEELEDKDINEAVRIGVAIARALAHTHKASIIHRDVKPANVLMDCTVNPPIPMITDFSLAMISDPLEKKLTQTGVAVGTPYYMSPEQTFGIREEIGPHTDTYSLGAVLYEMLCEAPPFKAKSIRELYHKIQKQQPASLMKKNPKISPLLEQIIFKALEKKINARYKDCDEFADIMEKYLRGEPIVLEKPGFVAQVAKFVNNNERILRHVAFAAILTIIAAMSVILIFRKNKSSVSFNGYETSIVEQKKLFKEQMKEVKRDLFRPTVNERENFAKVLSDVEKALVSYTPPLHVENLIWQAHDNWQKKNLEQFWKSVTSWQKLPIDDFLIAIDRLSDQDAFSRSLAYMHIGHLDDASIYSKQYKYPNELYISLRSRIEWLKGIKYEKAKTTLANLKNGILKSNQAQFPLLLVANNHVVEAHSLASKLERDFPDNPLWTLILGIVYKEINLLKLAEEKFSQIDSPSYMRKAALFHKGLCYKRQAFYEKAVQEFRDILEETPDEPHVFYELLICGIEMGNGQIRPDIQKDISNYSNNLLKISDTLSYEQAALVYQYINEKNEIFDYVRERQNGSSNFHYLKGLMALAQGNDFLARQGAIEEFSSSLDIDASNYKAAFEIAKIYEADKQYDEAFHYYSHAFWCAPNWKKRKNIYTKWMSLAFEQKKYWHLGQFLQILDKHLSVPSADGFKSHWIELCKNAKRDLDRIPRKNNWMNLQGDAISYFLDTADGKSYQKIDFLPQESMGREGVMLKAMLLCMSGEYDKALQQLSGLKVNNNHLLDREIFFLRARILEKKNQVDNAYQDYQELCNKDFHYKQRTSYLISVQQLAKKLQMDEPHKAIGILKKTLEESKNNALDQKARGYFLLGNIYEEIYDIDNAIASYKLAIGENPAWFKPYLNLGRVYEKQDIFKTALEYYRFAQPIAREQEDLVKQKIDDLEFKMKKN